MLRKIPTITLLFMLLMGLNASAPAPRINTHSIMVAVNLNHSYLMGVTVTLYEGSVISDTALIFKDQFVTGYSGYSFDGLTAGEDYTVICEPMTGVNITPPFIEFPNLSKNEEAIFTAAFTD